MPFSTNNKIQIVDGSGDPLDTGLGVYGAETLRVTMAADDVLLSAMNTNLADIETLLTTIDSDTGTISTYAEAIYTDMDALSRSTGNVATTAGHKGIGALAVRNDTLEAYAGIADGDYTFLQASSIGALYVTGAEVENAAVQSQPSLIGGRYDSSARTLGDGDAGAVALNASGHMLMDVVDGGQLDTIIDTLETTLTAIETDQAAIETLLTGIDADTDAIKTAVQILDDWDDSNYANVNINLAGSDAPTGGGAESGALRVTLANDSTGVISIDDGGNTITVDGTVTANLGSGDNNIGNVDIVTLPASTNTIEIVGDVAENANAAGNPVLIGGRYDSSARTLGNTDVGALALNASGHVLIDVVDGGVLESTLDAVETLLSFLTTIDNDTSALATTVSGTELQVDVVAALPAGTNAIGKLAANSGVDIGDVDVTSISAGSNIIGKIGHDITGLASDDNPSVGTIAEKISGADGDVACKRIDIMAHPDNTGYIWVGDSAVSVNGLNGGIRLSPGDFYSMDIDNTGDVYAVATVADENVCFNYFT